MTPSGFIGALGLLATIAGAIVAFVTFPGAYAATWPWLSAHVVKGYGPDIQAAAPWLWSFLLGFGLFAAVRTAILLVISASGLLVALRMIFRNRRD